MSLFSDLTKLEFDYLIATCNFINEEFFVFKMKRSGAFNYQIAQALNISESTVKRRLVSIKGKVLRELADSKK